MSRDVVFMGDEVTGAGFRLAGLRAVVPKEGREHEFYKEARETAGLIYLTPEVAARIPGLEADMNKADPMVLIVDDINRRGAVPDLPARILGLLGLKS